MCSDRTSNRPDRKPSTCRVPPVSRRTLWLVAIMVAGSPGCGTVAGDALFNAATAAGTSFFDQLLTAAVNGTLDLLNPPPADEQAAMQQKIMQYMMIFIGFMFYHVPSGLCLYFIASSLWGVAERKLMPKPRPPKEPPAREERRKKKDRPLSGSRR